MSLDPSRTSPGLGVLLVDYQASRDDDRQQQVQLAAFFGIGATLLGALFGLILQAAPFNSDRGALHLNPVIIFFLPMIPLILLAYAVWFSAGISLRGYYLRALEREISTQAGTTIQLHGELPVPSLAHLEVLLFRTGPGGPTRMRLISNLVGLVSFSGLAAGASLCLVTLNSWAVRAVFVFVYAPLIALIFWVALTTSIKPRRFFSTLYGRIPRELSRSLGDEVVKRHSGERSLASYLCLPRPGELLKSSLYLLFAALAILAYSSFRASIWNVSVFWLIFELFAYQARYAWNDLRGLTQDAGHPARRIRGRVPEVGTVMFRVVVIETMIVLRIGLAIALLWLLPTWEGRYAGVFFLLGLAAVSISYEIARSRTSVGRSGYRPVAVWAVYIILSLGYGLRGSAGFWYGSTGRAGATTMTIVFCMCSALGAAGVLVFWLYEAETLISGGSEATAVPSHLALLHETLARVPNSRAWKLSSERPQKRSVLAKRDLAFSPWGGFLLSAAGLSGLLGADLWVTRTEVSGGHQILFWPLILGAVLGLGLGCLTQRTSVLISCVMASSASVIAFLALLGYGSTTAAVSVLPTLICLLSYLAMRMGTYEQLAEGILYPLKQSRVVVLVTIIGFQRLILGKQTTMMLATEYRARRKQKK
jgi:hypothetical protein